jgi:flagellar motility protein MotE (MotC chaperone)
MIRFARDFRLIPIVLIATICLFALKVSGLVFNGGYTLADRLRDRATPGLKIDTAEKVPAYPKIIVAGDPSDPSAPAAKKSWAQEMFNFNGTDSPDVTGSVDKQEKPAEGKTSEKDKASKDKASKKKPDEGSVSDGSVRVGNKPPTSPKLEVDGNMYALTPGHINSPGERAILESLQKRREQLDARARDLDMRESLLKAAEQRVQAKVVELKDVEKQVKSAAGNRDKAETKRFKDIITMYENMKAKDAARIFNRLDMKTLVEVSTKMKPRAMSSILAQMSPDAAEHLTVELATLAGGTPQKQAPKQLPKIEGKPDGG